MPFELVPIKCRIGLRKNGEADHPDFNQLSPGVRNGGMNWSIYIDSFGSGWLYDKVCSHKDSDAENPEVPVDHPHRNCEAGIHYGCILVPEAFAEEAVVKFPDTVSIITEEELEMFYDDRHAKHQQDVIEDADVLRAIKDRMVLEADPLVETAPLTEKEKKQRKDALDPEVQTEKGVRKNLNRRWATYKKKRGMTIRSKEAKPK